MGTVKQVIIGKSSLNADWTMKIFLPNCNDLLHIFTAFSIVSYITGTNIS